MLDARQAVQDVPGSWVDRLAVGVEALVQLLATWIRREPLTLDQSVSGGSGPVPMAARSASPRLAPMVWSRTNCSRLVTSVTIWGSTSHVEPLVGPASVSHSSESPRQPVKKIRSPARAASTTSRCVRSSRRRARAGARGFPPSRATRSPSGRNQSLTGQAATLRRIGQPRLTSRLTPAPGRPPAILSDPCSQPVHEVQDFRVRSRLTDRPRWCRRARRDWRRHRAFRRGPAARPARGRLQRRVV